MWAKPQQSGWLRAIDEALVVHHLDVANADDDYAEAKRKLNLLLCTAQDIGAYFAKQEIQDLQGKLQYVIDNYPVKLEDGCYTFPDGDYREKTNASL